MTRDCELRERRSATVHMHTPHVAVVTLNCPPTNILTVALRGELQEIFDDLDRDLNVRCVVIASALDVYTAGADLREDQRLSDDEVMDYIGDFHRVVHRIEKFRTPVIAAINGGAIGGGLEFVLACDIRIASTRAFFVAAGVNVGLIVSFWRLPRIVGLGPAKEILLTGSRYTAEQALNWGLVTEVHAPEMLLDAALRKADRIATRAPLSVEATKFSTNEALDLDVADGDRLQVERFVKMFRTADHKEALEAFFDRRKAHFQRR